MPANPAPTVEPPAATKADPVPQASKSSALGCKVPAHLERPFKTWAGLAVARSAWGGVA